MDLVLERIELRPRRRAGRARRLRRTQRRSDRIARQTRPPGELLDRDAAQRSAPCATRPTAPHRPTPLAPASIATIERGSGSTRTPPPTRPRGSVFDRRRGVSSHPAPTPRHVRNKERRSTICPRMLCSAAHRLRLKAKRSTAHHAQSSESRIGGFAGEDSTISSQVIWWPPSKLSGRYLSRRSRENADAMPQQDDSIPVAGNPLERSAHD